MSSTRNTDERGTGRPSVRVDGVGGIGVESFNGNLWARLGSGLWSPLEIDPLLAVGSGHSRPTAACCDTIVR